MCYPGGTTIDKLFGKQDDAFNGHFTISELHYLYSGLVP
jgi:hypothetical protein